MCVPLTTIVLSLLSSLSFHFSGAFLVEDWGLNTISIECRNNNTSNMNNVNKDTWTDGNSDTSSCKNQLCILEK